MKFRHYFIALSLLGILWPGLKYLVTFMSDANVNPKYEDHVRQANLYDHSKADQIEDTSVVSKENGEKSHNHWKPTAEEHRKFNETHALIFGKVIDLSGQPISRAYINCTIRNGPENQDERSVQYKSDENGEFIVDEKNAPYVTISVFSHNEYFEIAESKKHFHVFEIPKSMPQKHKLMQPQRINTSKENPAIFKLRKKGLREPLIFKSTLNRITKQPAALTPIKDLDDSFTTSISYDSKHDIRIRHWFNSNSKRNYGNELNGKPIYDWGYEITLQNGAILQMREVPSINRAASFIAPNHGYQKKLQGEYTSAMSDQEHRYVVTIDAFLKFEDNTYGRAIVEFVSLPTNVSVLINSYYNPSGSPNLEPDPKKYIKNNSSGSSADSVLTR